MRISDQLQQQRTEAMPKFLKSIGECRDDDKEKWRQFCFSCELIEPKLLPYCKIGMPETFKNVEGRYKHEFCATIDDHMPIYFIIGVDYVRLYSGYQLASTIDGFAYRLQYDAPLFGYYAVPNGGQEMGYYKQLGEALAAASYYYHKNTQS